MFVAFPILILFLTDTSPLIVLHDCIEWNVLFWFLKNIMREKVGE